MRFEVWDSGRGVPGHLRERIFEEYFQLDNQERARDKGLGLGLAIVDRLSRLLSCPVRLRSVLGRGSCFSLCAERCAVPTPAEEGEAELPGRIGSDDALVAFVDDDESVLEAMLELFDSWGVALAVGADAHEVAADLLEMDRAPSLILCDYRLREGRDGIEAIAFLRGRFGAHIPALLITGDTGADTLQRIHASGLPLLHKPLKPAKLRAMLAHYLGARGG
jgi:CheY-like chemotaxis protein